MSPSELNTEMYMRNLPYGNKKQQVNIKIRAILNYDNDKELEPGQPSQLSSIIVPPSEAVHQSSTSSGAASTHQSSSSSGAAASGTVAYVIYSILRCCIIRISHDAISKFG